MALMIISDFYKYGIFENETESLQDVVKNRGSFCLENSFAEKSSCES